MIHTCLDTVFLLFKSVITDILVRDEISPEPDCLDPLTLEPFLANVLETTKLSIQGPVQVNLVMMSDAEIAQYNHQYRHKNAPTNVLAFPTVEKNQPWPILPDHPIVLGDILMSWETVLKQAQDQGKDVFHHVMHLWMHGFLHLLHYDHETAQEAEEMEGIERAVFQHYGWPDPYA